MPTYLVSHAEAVRIINEQYEEIERLRERCEGYKGQVWAGSQEIERLRAELRRRQVELDSAAKRIATLLAE